MRRHIIPGALSLVLILTSIGASIDAAARSGVPDHDGSSGSRIYWSQFRDLDFSAARVVVADTRGRHLRVLTHPATGVNDIDPKVSPDGTRVLFERDLPDTTKVGIVNADGSGERLLNLRCTAPCVGPGSPTWTPDGRHIIYTRGIGPFDQVNNSLRSAVLWRSDLSGRHQTRLSQKGIDGAFEDYDATFAPRGYIVFIRVRNADIKSAAFRMNPDGSQVRRLTPWALDADELSVSPAESGPTRDLVVFETFGHAQPKGTAQAVATVTAAPQGQRRTGHIRYLTSPRALPVQNFNPAWSPDGRQIAFVRFSFVESAQPPVSGNIWRMRWNGTHKRQVSRSPLFEFRPAWGPRPRHQHWH